jgi:hypothetical protein
MTDVSDNLIDTNPAIAAPLAPVEYEHVAPNTHQTHWLWSGRDWFCDAPGCTIRR